MIHIIITSYKEPKSTIRAVRAFLNQKIKEKFKIIIVDPFPEIEEIMKKEFKKEFKKKQVEFFLDPGAGKAYALNTLFEQIYSKPEDIIISTDGDVYVSENALSEIIKAFKDKQVGAITTRIISLNSRKNMFGYWSHLLFAGIHNTRKKLSKQKKFFECSGYLFAIRNGVLQGFPENTSEDSIIPFLFWKKGYNIKYLPNVEVYVLNPQDWKDWKLQKIRNIKAHENLSKIAPDMPRTKTLANEIQQGTLFALTYPKTPHELFYTLLLFPARLYIYLQAFKELKRKSTYQDGWRAQETQSTKPLD